MKAIATVSLVSLLGAISALADISMPKKDNFYDKAGRGLANVAHAPAEIFDSTFTLAETEGGTVGYTKGFVQGVSRMVMDIGHGVFDLVTAPFPAGPGGTYRSYKERPYDSMAVNEYPPADLNNWY